MAYIVGINNSKAQTSEEMYKKVFGHYNQEERTVVLDATLGEFLIGEVKVTLRGEEIIFISGQDLTRLLENKVREEKKDKYFFTEGVILPKDLPFKLRYHPTDLRIAFEIPEEDLRPKNANVYDDLIPYYAKQAMDPAAFSMGLNYKLEQSFTNEKNQKDNFFVQTDSFINIQNISIENQMNYLTNRDHKWIRQRTRAIYDHPQNMQSFEMGDIYYPIIGYQQSKALGGASFYKDFSLNPYRDVRPMSSFEYKLESRSLVKTYVNNILLKSDYMSSGVYSVKDIPLNNGINNIKVEATDEFGVTKVFIFNEFGSLDLLAEGVTRYSMAVGYPSYDKEGILKYENKDAFVTGFYQFGYNRFWTPGIYGQGNNNYQLLGTNQVLATRFGNWGLDLAGSRNDLHKGIVSQLTYQLNMFGAYWYDSHVVTGKVEYRSAYFNENGEKFRNAFDYTGSLNYTVPFLKRFNISVGGSYQNPVTVDYGRIGYNASLTTQLFDSSSLSFFAGRNRDEFKEWSNQLYFFFNMSFGASSTFVSAFYDKESDTKRLTAIHDTGNLNNDLKVIGNFDDNKFTQNASLDLQKNTTLADLGIRQEVTKNKNRSAENDVYYRTSLRLLGSFSFASNGRESAFSIGRPINNSFVIFKPNSDWDGQNFGVQTGNDINESRTGLFGETLVSGLTPYQYKRLLIDRSELEAGYSLDQESFVVFPRRNSGHLFVIGNSGKITVKGRMLNSKKKPIALALGFWTNADGHSVAFFTDRAGEFLIEGVEAGKGKIQLDSSDYKEKTLDLTGALKGIKEVGNIVLKSKEREL